MLNSNTTCCAADDAHKSLANSTKNGEFPRLRPRDQVEFAESRFWGLLGATKPRHLPEARSLFQPRGVFWDKIGPLSGHRHNELADPS